MPFFMGKLPKEDLGDARLTAFFRCYAFWQNLLPKTVYQSAYTIAEILKLSRKNSL